MTAIDYNPVADETAPRATRVIQPEIADLLGIARRGWFIMAAGAILGLACALWVLSTIPPVYKANSRIVFERTLSRYLQTNKATNQPMIEDWDTLGQIYVISSESNLLPVVRSLSLASDPDFVGVKDGDSLRSRLSDLFRNTAHALGLAQEPAEDTLEQRSDPEKVAFDHLVRNLSVSREDVASVITVAFSSKDPVKAATIVNAIVDNYMQTSIANKAKSTKMAGKAVQERVEELKRQAADAERALIEYKMANNLISSAKGTLSSEQLAALQTHLTSARVAMAEAKARMDRINSKPEASADYETAGSH